MIYTSSAGRNRLRVRSQLLLLVVASAILWFTGPARVSEAFLSSAPGLRIHPLHSHTELTNHFSLAAAIQDGDEVVEVQKKKVVIVGAGWGGLSAAHALSSQTKIPMEITVVDASPKVGGLVRDGFQTLNGKIK